MPDGASACGLRRRRAGMLTLGGSIGEIPDQKNPDPGAGWPGRQRQDRARGRAPRSSGCACGVVGQAWHIALFMQHAKPDRITRFACDSEVIVRMILLPCEVM